MDGLLERRRLSLHLASTLLDRVQDEASRGGHALAMAVVDEAGNVIASRRMDDASLGAMRLAVGKAYTAVLWGAPSGAFSESTQPGGDDWGWTTTDPQIVVYAGGIPLQVDGALVGAVGASGAAAAEDEACVLAAARALGFDSA